MRQWIRDFIVIRVNIWIYNEGIRAGKAQAYRDINERLDSVLGGINAS